MKKFLCLIVILVLSAFVARGDDGKKIATLNDLKINDIIADLEGNLYLATEYGGFYISTDEGSTWKLTNSLTKKYNITCILYDDFEGLFCSTMDGAFIQSTDKGVTWRIRNYIPAIGNMVKLKKKFKVFSTDGEYGITFDNNNFAIYGLLKVINFHFTKQGTLYACGKAILRNDDIENNSQWIDVRNGLYLFSFSLVSDDKERIYVGTEKGIYYSDNKGESWSIFSTEIESYLFTSLFIDKSGRIIAGTDSSGLFITDDKGKTWKSIKNDFKNTKVKKFFNYLDNTLFAITENGLFVSKTKGDKWENLNSELYSDADSLLVKGWIPSINIYDLLPSLGSLYYLKFLNNDSSIVVKGNQPGFRFFNTQTGLLESELVFSDSLDIQYYKFITYDSIFMCIKKDRDLHFGYFIQKTNSFNLLFTIKFEYFRSLFPENYGLSSIGINYIELNQNAKEIYIYYTLSGYIPPKNYAYSITKFESRNLLNGEFLKFLDLSCIFSKDMNYYIKDNLKLFKINDELVYDIRNINGNPSYLNTAKFSSSRISPNNKFIVLDFFAEKKYIVIDFNSGLVLREVKYTGYYQPKYDISYDDNFLITASNESAIKIYDLNNSRGPFDQVVFCDGESNWNFDIAKNTNTIVFGGYDGILRLWKPNMNLDSNEEEPEPEPELINNLVFPNPAEDYIDIDVEANGRSPLPNDAIRIFNSIGECVIVRANDRSPLHLDISNLPPGIYFIRFGGNYAKFVKM